MIKNTIAAGDLRHRIAIQRLNPLQQPDSTGDLISSWQVLGKYWAFVRPLQGRELVNAKQIVETISHQITMRVIGPISAKDRIVFINRVFGIDHIYRDQETNIYYHLLAHELVGEQI